MSDVKKVLPIEVMEKRTFSATNGVELPYRFHLPENFDENKSYPVLIFLHGAGEVGYDNDAHVSCNVQLLENILSSDNPEYDCIMIAPQCAPGRRWVESNWALGEYDQDSLEMSPYLTAARELLLSVCEEYKADMNRLYIAGISMGGYGTWDFITRYPELFAAAAPCCGGADSTKASVIRDLPIWTFHGSADDVVPPTGTRKMVEALRANGSKVIYTEYEGVQHNSWENAYNEPDMLPWLFSKKK